LEHWRDFGQSATVVARGDRIALVEAAARLAVLDLTPRKIARSKGETPR
jgi:hypothetical protein